MLFMDYLANYCTVEHYKCIVRLYCRADRQLVIFVLQENSNIVKMSGKMYNRNFEKKSLTMW